MKLSSISLVGATLTAIVVSAAIASGPRSLERLNLFERDVDGELVDGLFTRTREERARRAYRRAAAAHKPDPEAARQEAARQELARQELARQELARLNASGQGKGAHGNIHLALAEVHGTAGTEHNVAYAKHSEAFEKTNSEWHRQKAWQHSKEAEHHFEQRAQNFAAYAGTRTDVQESLIKDRHNPLQAIRQCATDATLSQKYAADIIDHSNGLKPHPGVFNEPPSRHPIHYDPMPAEWIPGRKRT